MDARLSKQEEEEDAKTEEENAKMENDALTKSVSEAGKIVGIPTPTIDKIYKEVKSLAINSGCYVNPND